MKKSSTIILQAVVIIIGLGTLAFMLWEPHIEGRNLNSTVFEIYFNDPFLAYAYLASITYFVALYQAFKLLGYAGQNKILSQASIKALRIVKYCMETLVGFVVVAEACLFIFQRGKDDIAGGVFMGLLVIAISGVIAIAASVFEKHLQSALDIKSENDLVV